MKKCDVIIPIYNSPEWVKLCVYALIKNTPKENLGKIILMNDNSDELTCNLIENLKAKYENDYEIVVSKNETNLGFIKNVNRGFDLSTAEYVLLLNTDCMLSKNTIPKLIEHLEKDKKVALICPISSNAANLSLDIFENYSYMQVNEMLEENFKGMTFDACTVVGNCLMITRECIEKVGYLDEAYGMGYGDETDYQFKAHAKGFEAKVAIDTYVFHKSEVSFGTSKEKQQKLEHNRKIFFDRWGKEYNERMQEYVKNDPIEYINKNLKIKSKPNPDVLFFLPDIHQGAGGVHIVVDIVNYLNINGIFANILTAQIHDNYKEIMLFKPSFIQNINKLNPKCIVGTIYPSIFFCNTIGAHFNIPVVNFMQGYEPCFDNGDVYAYAEMAIRSSQNILAISKFLQDKCKNNFNKEAYVISNGINYDLLHSNIDKKNKERKTVTFDFRSSFPKGDFILAEILKQLTVKENNIDINVIYNKDIFFPVNNNETINIKKYKGPLDRKKVNDILLQSDIFVDASIMEGFGLMALEAMTAGNVPVLSESFGIDEYAKDGVNSFVIKEVNNAEKYVEKIHILLNDDTILSKMKNEALKTSKEFDFDLKVEEYINYFKNVKVREVEKLTKQEEKEIQKWLVNEISLFSTQNIKEANSAVVQKISLRRKIWLLFLKMLPRSFKTKVKNKVREMVNR